MIIKLANGDFDVDYFLVHLSGIITAFPKLSDFVGRLYNEDKLRFYNEAVKNKYYNFYSLEGSTLEKEVLVRRIFGVLLCSVEDCGLRQKIFKKMEETVPELVPVFDKFGQLDIYQKGYKDFLNRHKTRTVSYDARNSFLAFSMYFYLCSNAEFGDEFKDELEKSAIGFETKSKMLRKEDCAAHFDVSDIREESQISQSLEKVMTSITTGKELSSLLDILIVAQTVAREKPVSGEVYSAEGAHHYCEAVVEALKSGEYSINSQRIVNKNTEQLRKRIAELLENDGVDVIRALRFIKIFYTLLRCQNLSMFSLLENNTINKQERERIFNISLLDLPLEVMGDIPNAKFSDYLIALLVNQLIKVMVADRQFHSENSSETQFEEMKMLRVEKTALDKALKIKDEEINKLKVEIRNFEEQIRKLSKEAMAIHQPFCDEINRLNKQVDELSRELEEEKRKTEELCRLRSFAFEVQTNYVPLDTLVDVEGVINNKKIVIIGGHINWRNNLKKKYPKIKTMDGHIETADFSILKNADFVFLNTSNMNHGVYYKVMGVLRNSEVPFDYLGRTINQELYEKEMADILLRHEMKRSK